MQSSAKMIPKTWKKCGDVYSNDRKECVFVCAFCLEHAEHMHFVYSTHEASAFWKHIQQQHISGDCEIIEEPPAKKRQTDLFQQHDAIIMSHENESNVIKNSDSNDSYTIGKVTNNIQLLDIFHENLVDNFAKVDEVKKKPETNETPQMEVKTEIQLPDLQIEGETSKTIAPADDIFFQLKMENIPSNSHKLDNTYAEKTPNNAFCPNYRYDQGVYEISDDDDDDEDDLFTIVRERSAKNYLNHKDMIELSDDDDDEEDDTCTRPNTPQMAAKNTTNNAEKPEEEVNSDSTNSGYRYNCLQCQITFLNRNKLIEHLETHEIEERSMLNSADSFNPVDLVNCIPTPEVSPNEVDGHQNMNNQLQRYQCNYCPQRFFEVWQLDLHQRLHLSKREAKRKFKSRPFQCNNCGKRTSTEKAMVVHQRRFHSPESDFDTAHCELCQKRVLTKNLQQHMLVHSELRYKCNHCQQTYKQRQSLRKHMKKLHPFATTYINPSTQLPPPHSQQDISSYTAMLDTHLNTHLKQREQTPLPLGSSQVSQARLTPEEHELMYSFFLHCHSLNQNKAQTSVSTNDITDQTTS